VHLVGFTTEKSQRIFGRDSVLQEVYDNPKDIQENSMYFRHKSCQHKSTNHLNEGRNRRCVYENGVGQDLLSQYAVYAH